MTEQPLSYFKLFCASLQFTTRLPVPARYTADIDINDYAKGVITFPLVGVVVGMLCGFIFLLTQLWWGNAIAACCAVLAGALITGGFHLDGLADSADGLFSSRSREKMLEIMRDSRIGSNGTLALIFVILLKVLALYQLAEHQLAVLALLVAAPVLSRSLAVVMLMYQQRYARDNGLGSPYIGKVTAKAAQITLWSCVALIFILLGLKGLFYGAVVLVFALGYRAWINYKLGGQTGDTLGAGIELFELLFLLLMLA